jgi:hypothetical protein
MTDLKNATPPDVAEFSKRDSSPWNLHLFAKEG